MATIPDIQDLGQRPIPRRARGFVADRSGEINAEANQQFIGSVRDIGNAFAEREDRFSYAQAKSSLLQADIAARSSLKDDQDWATHEARYQEQMGKALENSSKMIRGNRDRALFEMDSKLDLDRGTQEVRSAAKSKEVVWGRAELSTGLESLRSAALSADDAGTREATIASAKDLITGAKSRGYLNDIEEANAWKQYRDSYAIGSLEMLSPEKRIEALNGRGVADYLQPDVRAKLLEHAKNENKSETIKRESQVASDALLAKHGSNFKSALGDAKKIESPEVRDATQSRIEHAMSVAEHFDAKEQSDTYEAGQSFIDGGGKFADMPFAMKARMKPSQVNSLRSYAEQTAGGGKVKTNQDFILRLSQLHAMDKQGFGDEDPTLWKDKLDESDYEKWVGRWSAVRAGKDEDGKESGYRSLAQRKTDRLVQLFGSAASKKGEKEKTALGREKFNTAWESSIEAYKVQHKRMPDAKEADRMLSDLTREYVTKKSWYNDTEKLGYEIDIADVPADIRAVAAEELKSKGLPVTESAIVDAYRKFSQ